MTIVTWDEKVSATQGKKPVNKGGSGCTYFEDYILQDIYWRYTWTNFTLNTPETVHVFQMESDDD